MIHHVVYCKLKPEVQSAQLEAMVRAARTWILKIPEVLSVRSGRNTDPSSDWQFFYAIEAESLSKLEFIHSAPYFLKFRELYLTPCVAESFVLNFQMNPSRPIQYS